MSLTERLEEVGHEVFVVIQRAPLPLLLLATVTFLLGAISLSFLALFIAAPIPRPALPSEKTFKSLTSDGKVTPSQSLPCWLDRWRASKQLAARKGGSTEDNTIEEAELFMSLVVPAYNEDERLGEMLQEAVDYLTSVYSESTSGVAVAENGTDKKHTSNGSAPQGLPASRTAGWEILVVSDGSTDHTVDTALSFARSYKPTNTKSKGKQGSPLPPDSIRVISLEHNRGKGGATIHGMRHVRGRYAVFADADGASRFEDLGKLVHECQRVEDTDGRGVAVGSRAHLVGSEAVVKRSFLRNLLMHSFHLLLRLLTPPATAAIKDTQCGFKLFSRASLPYIIPYMHSEGWIFDVEMLMLAESAGIPVAEVAVGWKEVKGSKLNVLWDSLGMAWGLAILRGAWGFGVYRR
ncbi:MAG: E2-like enzyme [Chaenotheca gracillima]|nr:MAG: E2-like enzyme [Chaenotheca gracillima]